MMAEVGREEKFRKAALVTARVATAAAEVFVRGVGGASLRSKVESGVERKV